MGAEVVYPDNKKIAVFSGGVVVPVGVGRMTPSEILAQIKDVVAQPYLGRDADKIGMTLLEAALYAAAKKAADGDLDALARLLDRLCGKPVQQVVQATGTLQEFLDMVAKEDPIDVAATPVDPMGD